MSLDIERTFTHKLIVLCNLTVVLWDLTPIWYLSEIWSLHTILLTVRYMTTLPHAFTSDVIRQYATPFPPILAVVIRVIFSLYLSHISPDSHDTNRSSWCHRNVPYLPCLFWHGECSIQSGLLSWVCWKKLERQKILLPPDNVFCAS